MTAAFDEFKTVFDDYLERCPEYPEEMYFLRYEGAQPIIDLHPDIPSRDRPEDVLEDFIKDLDDCQNYAVSKEVTSTYVFFNPDQYSLWLNETGGEDSALKRAEWAVQKIPEQVVTHVSDRITWFMVTNEPDWYKKVLPPHTENKATSDPEHREVPTHSR